MSSKITDDIQSIAFYEKESTGEIAGIFLQPEVGYVVQYAKGPDSDEITKEMQYIGMGDEVFNIIIQDIKEWVAT